MDTHNVSSPWLIISIYILPGHNANEIASAQTPEDSQWSPSTVLSASPSAGMNLSNHPALYCLRGHIGIHLLYLWATDERRQCTENSLSTQLIRTRKNK